MDPPPRPAPTAPPAARPVAPAPIAPAPVAPAPVAPAPAARPIAPAPVAPSAVPQPVAPPRPIAPQPAQPLAPPVQPIAPQPAPLLPPQSPPAALPANAAVWGPPAILPYRTGLPVPPGYHVERRSATGLVATGIGMTALGYVVGLGVAMDHHFEGSLGWMAVPVVGAWPAVAGSKVVCSAQDVPAAKKCLDNAYNQATTIAIVAVDGMVQATGVALLVAGLLSGHSELVRDDVQLSARQRPEGGFDIGVRGRF